MSVNFKIGLFLSIIILACNGIIFSQDKSNIDTLLEEIQTLRHSYPDSSLSLLNSHKDEILATGTPSQQTLMYLHYFHIYYYSKMDAANAKKSLFKAKQISKENEDIRLSAIYQNLGRFYHRMETSLDSALYYHLKGAEVARRTPNNYNLNFHYTDLANLYITILDFDKAQEYILKSLEIVREGGRRMDYGFTLGRAIEIFENSSDTSMLQQLVKELEEFRAQRTSQNIAAHNQTSARDNVEDRKVIFKEEIKKSDSLSNTTWSLVYRLRLGEEFLKINDYESTAKVLESGLHLISDTTTLMKHNFHAMLRRAYVGMEDFEKAYYHAQIVADLNQKILDEEKLSAINSIEAKYERLKNEKIIGDLQREQIINRRNNTILALFLSLAVVVLLALFYILKMSKKNIVNLEKKNSLISEMLSEKEFLIKEIHHRVKNNLQMISSLLQLQSRYVTENSAQEALSDGQARVRSMAILHQFLYTGDQLNKIHLPSFIDSLIENLSQIYNQGNKRIKISKNLEDINLDIAEMVPLGLILNEIIVNSYKYAFEGRDIGMIDISVNKAEDYVQLKVKDNGVGMDKTQTKEGFGSRLIQSFVKKLNADYHLESSPDNGTEITIGFKTTSKGTSFREVA